MDRKRASASASPKAGGNASGRVNRIAEGTAASTNASNEVNPQPFAMASTSDGRGPMCRRTKDSNDGRDADGAEVSFTGQSDGFGYAGLAVRDAVGNRTGGARYRRGREWQASAQAVFRVPAALLPEISACRVQPRTSKVPRRTTLHRRQLHHSFLDLLGPARDVAEHAVDLLQPRQRQLAGPIG